MTNLVGWTWFTLLVGTIGYRLWQRRRPAPTLRDQDARYLRLMQGDGVNLARPQPVTFAFAFANEAAARQATKEFEAAGYRIQRYRSEVADEWLCDAVATFTVTLDAVAEHRAVVTGIGERHDGEFGG